MANFSENLVYGKIGEDVISSWLQGRGHSIFPAYEKQINCGKGPQLFASHGNLVLPDLLAFRNGKVLWVEAKRKTNFTWHRITRRWVTGIDIRHYDEYQKVRLSTKFPVWILFWHPNAVPSSEDKAWGCPLECPTGLFGESLDILTANENHRSDKWGKAGMVYWAHEKLKLLSHDGVS
jgi:hypothetical protein